MNPHELFDKNYMDLVEEVAVMDLHDEDTTVALKNLKIFSECRLDVDGFDPESSNRWDRVKYKTSRIWDNETTRALIKAGGAFAGVALVAYSTIHKDHVIEKQALAQANQRPS